MSTKKPDAYGDGSMTKMLVYFLDGNTRTFKSFLHHDRKSKQAGIDGLKRYVFRTSVFPRVFHAEIYENLPKGKSLEVVIDGRNQPQEIQLHYSENRKRLDK
jgi:hypothetical protein